MPPMPPWNAPAKSCRGNIVLYHSGSSDMIQSKTLKMKVTANSPMKTAA